MGLSGIQGNSNLFGMWNLGSNRPDEEENEAAPKHVTRAEKDPVVREIGLSLNGFNLVTSLNKTRSLAFDPEAGLDKLPDINYDLDQDQKMSWIRNMANQIIEMPVSNEEKARLLSQYFYQNRQVLACLLVFIREQNPSLYNQLVPLLDSPDNPSALIKEEMEWLNVRLNNYEVIDEKVVDNSNSGEEVELLPMGDDNFFEDILKDSILNYVDKFFVAASAYAELGETTLDLPSERSSVRNGEIAEHSNFIYNRADVNLELSNANLIVDQVQNQFLETIRTKIDQAFSFVQHATRTNVRREVQRLVQQLLHDLEIEETRFNNIIAHNQQENRRLEDIPQKIMACYEYVQGQAQNLGLV